MQLKERPSTTCQKPMTTTLMSEETDYFTLIEKTVVRAVQQGAQSFSEVCLASKGAFPSDVLTAIQRLDLSEEVLTPKISRRFLDTHILVEDCWPEPSPVDYEWRFTYETAEKIAKTALEYCQRILCFGDPT